MLTELKVPTTKISEMNKNIVQHIQISNEFFYDITSYVFVN